MNEHGKANWENLLSQVEKNLADVLKTVQQREDSLAEQIAGAANTADAESVFRRVESFHERLSELQAKAEQSQQIVTDLDQQWAGGEKEIREHLERLDELGPKLRAWVGR